MTGYAEGLPQIPVDLHCPYHGTRLKLLQLSSDGRWAHFQCACGFRQWANEINGHWRTTFAEPPPEAFGLAPAPKRRRKRKA